MFGGRPKTIENTCVATRNGSDIANQMEHFKAQTSRDQTIPGSVSWTVLFVASIAALLPFCVVVRLFPFPVLARLRFLEPMMLMSFVGLDRSCGNGFLVGSGCGMNWRSR